MRKMILTVLLFTVPAAVHAADETSAPAPAPLSSNTYTVTKGDTLWDLAGKFYQDPHTWPRLWDANRTEVKDPNRIYPEQVLSVPGSGEKAPVSTASPAAPSETPAPSAPAISAEATPQPGTEEEPAEEAENAPEEENIVPSVPQQETAAAPASEQPAAAAPKQASVDKIFFSAEGFIAPRDWQTDGMIVGDKDKKMMLSEGDTVYVNLGSRLVKPGVQCNIYRKLGKVKDPDTGDVLGYEVRLVGRLTVTEGVGSDTATARVTNSREPIEVGDMVEIAK